MNFEAFLINSFTLVAECRDVVALILQLRGHVGRWLTPAYRKFRACRVEFCKCLSNHGNKRHFHVSIVNV